jgi:hypothetical protein
MVAYSRPDAASAAIISRLGSSDYYGIRGRNLASPFREDNTTMVQQIFGGFKPPAQGLVGGLTPPLS